MNITQIYSDGGWGGSEHTRVSCSPKYIDGLFYIKRNDTKFEIMSSEWTLLALIFVFMYTFYWHNSTLGCQFQDPSELLQFVTRSPDDGRYHCTLCVKFSHQNSSCTRNHVESNHFPDVFTYPCDQCEQTFTTKTNFNMHRSRKHKPNRKL